MRGVADTRMGASLMLAALVAEGTSVIHGAYAAGLDAAAAKTFPKSSVPKRQKIPKMPRMKPQSPMRLVMNAFLPASDALFFSYQ